MQATERSYVSVDARPANCPSCADIDRRHVYAKADLGYDDAAVSAILVEKAAGAKLTDKAKQRNWPMF